MYDSYPMNHNEDQDDNEFEPPSKSQLKRDAEALQEMGKTLVELPAARFAAMMAKLDLPRHPCPRGAQAPVAIHRQANARHRRGTDSQRPGGPGG